jgi:hypothetical protein
MKKIYSGICCLLFCAVTNAQVLKSLPNGGNKKASVSEQVGITNVTISYDRPGVKGREGKIYGTEIVHAGFKDPVFGTSRSGPWRAGANENTTIEFSTDVKIEGQTLPKGKYGFFIAYDPSECTVIFSRNNSSWGHFFYDDKEDALRVKVKPVPLDKTVEWLKYEFVDQTESSATIALQWEKVKIPFKVEVDLFNTMVEDYRQELRGSYFWNWEAMDQAARLCLDHNKNLEEGLKWSNFSVSYKKSFNNMMTNGELLDKLGQRQKADSMMKEALTLGTMTDLHYYARQLITQKKNKEALEVFQLNAKRHPKEFTTYAGLARGYSATGDYKTALANAKMALPMAPNDVNKNSVKSMIEKLEKGTDIN